MASIVYTSDLVNRLKFTLDENGNSPLLEFSTGVDQTDIYTADQGAIRLLNDEKDKLCQRGGCFALTAQFIAFYGNGQYNRRYDAFTPATDGTPGDTTLTGAKLWWAQSATMGGVALTFCGAEYLRAVDAHWQDVWNATTHTGQVVGSATSGPARAGYFLRTDARNVAIHPTPVVTSYTNATGAVVAVDTTGTVVVTGFYVPADMALPTATPAGSLDWCEPALAALLVDGAAIRAINKGRQDSTVTAREGDIVARYNKGVMDAWNALSPNLKNLDGRHPDAPFASSPVPMVARK